MFFEVKQDKVRRYDRVRKFVRLGLWSICSYMWAGANGREWGAGERLLYREALLVRMNKKRYRKETDYARFNRKQYSSLDKETGCSCRWGDQKHMNILFILSVIGCSVKSFFKVTGCCSLEQAQLAFIHSMCYFQ